MSKREALAKTTYWATLPRVLIGGKSFGDTDILAPMAETGERKTVLAEAVPGQPADYA